MFLLIDTPRAWYPVSWPGIADDGSAITNEIELRFRLLSQTANLRLAADAQAAAQAFAGKEVGEIDLAEHYVELALRIVEDWRYVAAEDGKALPFGRETLKRLLDIAGVWDAVLAAYRACSRGAEAIRAGN